MKIVTVRCAGSGHMLNRKPRGERQQCIVCRRRVGIRRSRFIDRRVAYTLTHHTRTVRVGHGGMLP